MGKTTLCKAIVGLLPVASGSIRFMGEELVGRTPRKSRDSGSATCRKAGDCGPR